MKKKTFISVGECMVELQAADDGQYRLGFAGDTLNTAWYVKALTNPRKATVDYFTSIGIDHLSQKMKSFFNANEIGTRFIRETSERTVGLYLITLTGVERNFTYWRNNSAARLLADDEGHLRSTFSQADFIYFSGVTLAILSPHHRKILLSVFRDLKLLGVTIVFDTNARRRLWQSDTAMKKAMIEGYKVATVALPTFDDDCAVFGDTTPADCVKRIASYGVHEIVVKNGSKPCLLLIGNDLIAVPPEPVEGIVDTTGAGDSFNAGYISGRLAGMDPLEAVKLGHRVAGRVICRRGALLDMQGFADLAVN